MPFDGFTTFSVVKELKEKLILGKINKIYQPESDEIILNVHCKGNKYNLLISANTNHPRIHLTDKTKDNPSTPPMFCMLLRKNLNNGTIVDISQTNFDRIIEITIQGKNELGDQECKRLIVEIMGRHSNISLVKDDSMKIIESIKRVGKNISSYREVLPGKVYIYPPQTKFDPFLLDNSLWDKLIIDHGNNNKTLYKFIMDSFMGISPAMSHELCHRAKISSDSKFDCLNNESLITIKEVIIDTMEKASDIINPTLYTNINRSKIYDFSAIEYTFYELYTKSHYSSISNLLEDYYFLRDNVLRVKNKASQILQSLQNKLDRNYNKYSKQIEEYKAAEDSQIFQLYGELITSNIYQLKKGQEVAQLVNYYDNTQVEIPLSLQLTPSENAQKYFKRYNKGKRAQDYLIEQIKATKEEIYYLESQIDNINKSTTIEEFNEIKEELIENGYAQGSKQVKKKKKLEISKPLHYNYKGYDIYVGKNNRQNEYLTLKFSNKEDVWLHVKDIPGSHVIIKMDYDKIDEDIVTIGALLAAYYSKSRNSENVPVDYTAVKYVKKPKGSKTGMVIYTDQRTLYVTPKEEKILSIDVIE